MDADSRTMKYGPYSSEVVEVVDFAKHGNLVGGIGPPPAHKVTTTHEMERVHTLEYHVPHRYKANESFLIWRDILANEVSTFFCITEEEVPHATHNLHRCLAGLERELIDVVKERLPKKYADPEYRDYEMIAYCIWTIAYHRAIFGIKEGSFFERMFDLYKSGGYPCGWEGIYPEGRFIVYYPPAEELASE